MGYTPWKRIKKLMDYWHEKREFKCIYSIRHFEGFNSQEIIKCIRVILRNIKFSQTV